MTEGKRSRIVAARPPSAPAPLRLPVLGLCLSTKPPDIAVSQSSPTPCSLHPLAPNSRISLSSLAIHRSLLTPFTLFRKMTHAEMSFWAFRRSRRVQSTICQIVQGTIIVFPKRRIVSCAKLIVHLRPVEVHRGLFDPLPREYWPALHIGSLDFFQAAAKSAGAEKAPDAVSEHENGVVSNPERGYSSAMGRAVTFGPSGRRTSPGWTT
jgi:hypothetical protein